MECTNSNGCTLDRAEMTVRVTAWRTVASQAISREIQPDRITSVYPSDPKLIKQLKDLIDAEALCCSFLKFSMKEERHQTVVELVFPVEARSLVEGIISTDKGPNEEALTDPQILMATLPRACPSSR